MWKLHSVWLVAIINVASCHVALARPSDLVACPSPCKCTSYTAVCSSLQFDSTEILDISGLKLMSPIEPVNLSHQIFRNLGMRSLASLMIINATIVQLDKSAFDGLESLYTISVLNSVVPPIDPQLFANLRKLKILNLSGSFLKSFENVNSSTIEELVLKDCGIKYVSENIFKHLPSLNFINLAKNNIRDIHVAAFAEQEDLEELVLSNNNLENISFDIFTKNMFLASLALSHNPINKIKFNVDVLLEKLSLNSCKLTEFSDGPNRLSYLDLRHNNIKIVKVGNMADLQYLYFSHNNISNIEGNTFENNSQLNILILDNNPISKLPPLFNLKHDQFSLQNFSCQNCGLKELHPYTFRTMTGLNALDLSNNILTEIGKEVLSPLTGLQILKLSKNKISSIAIETFSQNTLLRKLDLSENQIPVLNAEALQNNTKLELLDLSYGQVEKLWKTPTRVKLNSLSAINAASNPLTTLSLDELYITPNLEILDIDNIFAPCSEIQSLLPYLEKNNIGPTIIKLHENTVDASVDEYDDNHYKSWNDYIKIKGCTDISLPIKVEDQENQSISDETSEEEDFSDFQPETEDPWIDDNDNIDDEPLEYDVHLIRAIEHDRFSTSTYNKYAFLWPTLVFLFTCFLVLLVAVNVTLLVLRKRGALSRNVPQIKSWGSSNRVLKRHCGSIYRPLTEDLSGSKTPIITRSLIYSYKNGTPGVHNI